MDNIHRPTLSPLPLPATRKLDQIERLAADAVALTQISQSQIRDLELEVPHALNVVDTANDPDQRAAAQADLEALEHRIAERRDETMKRRRRAEECSQTVARIRDWQATRPRNASFVPISSPAPLQDGESIIAAIGRVRDAIYAKQVELQQITIASPPLAEMKEMVRKEVNTFASRGAPQISMIGGNFRIDLGLAPNAPIGESRLYEILCALFPDVVQQHFNRRNENLPTSGERMPSDMKAARTEALTREILALERQEEILVTSALENGDPVSRREGADVMAILGIAFASEAEAVAA